MSYCIFENIIFLTIIITVLYIIINNIIIYYKYEAKYDDINEGLYVKYDNIFDKFNNNFKLIFPGNYTEISYRYNDINHNTKKFCDKFILPVLNNINKTNKIYTIIDYIYFNSKIYRWIYK